MSDDAQIRGSKGIKVKDLARELGITSRALIDRCRAEGMFVQNSITKLNKEAAARVRSWLENERGEPGPQVKS